MELKTAYQQILGLIEAEQKTMASEAPSWADQWGAGGFGSMEEDNYATKQDTSNEKKSDAKGGINKAKAAAMSGAQKLKSGASSSFKWVKRGCLNECWLAHKINRSSTSANTSWGFRIQLHRVSFCD
ncbi:hypothetical protein SADUNF_Sadunf04G0007300 [Salix dunnii]|uniref:Uncharacterized protein n=1 Tax=Salix dunnii TaxID=1413687 RepID=A0A835K688_9ROSI|nr:hypothetical protein SADUNF_Sadunf04G0007300 [Salix dunnii]